MTGAADLEEGERTYAAEGGRKARKSGSTAVVGTFEAEMEGRKGDGQLHSRQAVEEGRVES
jgi:hypothetical protein